ARRRRAVRRGAVGRRLWLGGGGGGRAVKRVLLPSGGEGGSRSETDEGDVGFVLIVAVQPAEHAPSSERLRRPPSPPRGEGQGEALCCCPFQRGGAWLN